MSETLDISGAAHQLRETIALRCGDLADKLLDLPEAGTPEWVEQYQQRDTPEGQARLREWHLVKMRICREADVDQTGDALNAKKAGATWQDIADACGITRQAAYDRWAKHLRAVSADRDAIDAATS